LGFELEEEEGDDWIVEYRSEEEKIRRWEKNRRGILGRKGTEEEDGREQEREKRIEDR
jgi:hypothetical protein